jgi:hypothetical protein
VLPRGDGEPSTWVAWRASARLWWLTKVPTRLEGDVLRVREDRLPAVGEWIPARETAAQGREVSQRGA